MKPYFQTDSVTLYHGDCREIIPVWLKERRAEICNGSSECSCASNSIADVTIADPPYAETSLGWDRKIEGWLDVVPTSQLWCFGSMRFFMNSATAFTDWTFAQDIIWEKHNGSIFHRDRFRRVHEHVCHFYKGPWGYLYKDVQVTNDATSRTLRRKTRPAHSGHIDDGPYQAVDGGPRMQRSVLRVRSCHGRAIHPTEKPMGVLIPLIQYSCPPGGLVLDPCCGSGSTLDAARRTGRRAVGIEIEEGYCEAAAKRLSQGMLEAV